MRSPVALSVLAVFGRLVLALSLLSGILVLVTSLYTEPAYRPLLGTGGERVFNWAALLIALGIMLQGLVLWAVCEALVFIGHTVIDISNTIAPPPPEYEYTALRRVPVMPGTSTRVRTRP